MKRGDKNKRKAPQRVKAKTRSSVLRLHSAATKPLEFDDVHPSHTADALHRTTLQTTRMEK